MPPRPAVRNAPVADGGAPNPRAARRPDEGGRVADEHVFAMSIEASGEVRSAPAIQSEQTDTDEAAPLTDNEELSDG